MKWTTKFPKLLALLTVGLGILPFIIYLFERKLGLLTTPDIWYATGGNHGPWRYDDLEGLTVYLPLMVLFFITLWVSISKSVKNRDWTFIFTGIFLIIIQLAFLFAQLYFLGWTVD